ncbi:uncharacterized protein LOC122088410 [Macadamia integrifolia]|uniref:uncharacterized protein LOC122088410 n=1 Tax=Macadamia integrifolia TaxID=60698 RepID=UPI001C4F3FFF|nr:uncharacterized protein LOC122088410 [Macadamia integrifolia]
MGLVGIRVRWWCLFFAMVIITTTAAAARNSILLSEKAEETVVVGMEMEEEAHEVHGRFLKVRLNDYNDPSANHGHDPKNRGGGSGHRGGGRGSNDTTP